MLIMGIIYLILLVAAIILLRIGTAVNGGDQVPGPEKKAWDNTGLMVYLNDYPNQCGMKNHKVLELLRENRILRDEVNRLRHIEKYKGVGRNVSKKV